MAEVQVKNVKAMSVMSLSFTGPYDQTPDRLDDLMSWLLRAGHPYNDRPLGLFYDDPAKVAPENLRAEVCLPVEEQCGGFEGIERKELPAVTVASVTYTGPYDKLPEVYAETFKWIGENGYTYVDGQPIREVYCLAYGEVGDPEAFGTEVQYPVVKA